MQRFLLSVGQHDVLSRPALRAAVIRFILWVGQTESVIRKEIELRLKDYDDALQKHGVKCLYKGITALTLGGLAVQMFGALADPLQAVMVGAGVTASVALASIDGKPPLRDEIALVVEARKKLAE